jgi:protein-S-isoprenylcysteine O-methyltransferase Ste14
MLIYLQIIAALWIGFMALLFIPALRGGAPVEKRSSRYIRQSCILVLVIGGLVIVMATFGSDLLALRVVPDSPLAGIAGIVLTVAGLGFSAWARHHLGRYWSSTVMITAGHRLIRTGPYRFVRNPMYTGILIAFVGAAIAIGEMPAFVALMIGLASILVKIQAEEEILLEKFGGEYLQYKREVRAAIIPWVL